MRKLFLLLSALVLSLLTNAAVIEVYPTSPNPTDNIRRAVRDNASAGDIIMLMSDDVAYEESSDYMILDKDLTIMPAEGKHPIIKMSRFAELTSSAKVKFIGINFDGSEAANTDRGRCLRPYDTSEGKIVKFEDCEFYGFKSHVIYCSADYNLDSCIINNCYFHDNAMNSVYFYKSSNASVQTAKGVIVTNSTFTNRGNDTNGSVIEVCNQGSEPILEDVELTVDHCTFYNNQFGTGDYAPVRSHKMGKVSVTNCIFAHPTEYAKYAVYCYGGLVSNCLTYNLTSVYRNWAPCPTLKSNQVADPLFESATNFSYPGNWVTMELSPACGSATDGTNLGDPRWYTSETLPSTDFASPYQLLGTKAVLFGEIRLNSSNHIAYKGESVPGIASWKLNVTKACAVQASVNMEAGSESGCELELVVFDSKGNKVDAVQADYVENDTDFPISGTLYFPEAGNYTIRLNNGTGWSSAKIEDITLTYAGGAVQNLPGTTAINEAWYGAGGTRADGKISYSSWNTENSFVKWNAATAENLFCKVILHASVSTAHHFYVQFYEQGQDEPFATLNEDYTEYNDVQNLDINLGKIYIAGGKNLIIKVTNPVSGGEAEVVSLEFEEIAIPTIAMPGELLPADAMLSERARVVNDSILFTDYGDENHISSQWAKWKISVPSYGYYKFTLSAYDAILASSQRYILTILSNDESQVIASKPSAYSTTLNALTADLITDLEAGNYIVKVQNDQYGSTGRVLNIVGSYIGGGIVNLSASAPVTLLPEQAVMLNGAYIENDSINFNNSSSACAKWTVHSDGGYYAFTTNAYKTIAEGGQEYTISIYNKGDETTPISFKQSAWTSAVGAYSFKSNPVNLPEGNYVVKIQNISGSKGRLMNIVAAVAGGATINLSTTSEVSLNPDDALLVDGAIIDNDSLNFEGSSSAAAKWNIHSDGGYYTFTTNAFNAYAGTGQRYTISIYNKDNETTAIDSKESSWTSAYGPYSFTSDPVKLPEGYYVVKIQNYSSSSKGRVMNIAANYAGGAVQVIPNDAIDLSEALLYAGATRDNDGLHFNGSTSANVKWNISAPAGYYNFTMNVLGSTGNYSKYKLTILDSGNDEICSPEIGRNGTDVADEVTFANIHLAAAGNYTLKLANVNSGADGYLLSLSVAEAPVVILKESDENMDAINNNLGEHVAVLERTFNTGVYNSICLPFNVSSNTEMKNIFGEGYELLEMTAATLEGGVLTLNFATPDNNIQYGRPYLIKPTKDVENPIMFRSHSITNSTSHLVVSGDDANFVGVLYKQNLGTHPENLYLGTDGNLYFSNSDVTIKGFRGYFHVNVSNPQQAVKHARIVAQGQVVTSIDLVNEANEGIVKTIENGQLIIVRDGVRYNAQGQLICK